MRYILAEKLVELTGHTVDAINSKRKNGIWKEGTHWRKRRNRIYYDLLAIERWIETGK